MSDVYTNAKNAVYIKLDSLDPDTIQQEIGILVGVLVSGLEELFPNREYKTVDRKEFLSQGARDISKYIKENEQTLSMKELVAATTIVFTASAVAEYMKEKNIE